MKRPTLITGTLLVLALPVAIVASRPVVPTDTYQVTIHAQWESLDSIGAVPALIEVRTDTSAASYDLLVGPVFTVTVLDPPPYTVRTKGFWHLATGGTTDTDQIDLGLQLMGDAPSFPRDDTYCPWPPCYRPTTGDNVIEVTDFSRLRRWFGEEMPPFTPDALGFAAVNFEINQGGPEVIDTQDFNFISHGRFGLGGYEFP